MNYYKLAKLKLHTRNINCNVMMSVFILEEAPRFPLALLAALVQALA